MRCKVSSNLPLLVMYGRVDSDRLRVTAMTMTGRAGLPLPDGPREYTRRLDFEGFPEHRLLAMISAGRAW
jgi:hypothetical protein